MKIVLRTSIDCCKRFMGEIKNAKFIPNEGDWVTVHKTDKFVIEMKVCYKNFIYSHFNHNKIDDDIVEIYLSSPNGMNIPAFEEVLELQGY